MDDRLHPKKKIRLCSCPILSSEILKIKLCMIKFLQALSFTTMNDENDKNKINVTGV